jgi:hypothetical protein
MSNLALCFFSHAARLEGADRSLLELVAYLTKNHEVRCTVVLPYDGPLRQRIEEVGAAALIVGYSWWCADRRRGAQEISGPLGNSLDALLGTLRRELTAIDPDVICLRRCERG